MPAPIRVLAGAALLLAPALVLAQRAAPAAQRPAPAAGVTTPDRFRPAPERRDPRLEARLAELTRGFQGDVGIYVRHLRTGRTATLRADESFPTASMVKVPILVGLFDAVRRGTLDYNAPLTFRDSVVYKGDPGLIAKLRDSSRVPLPTLALHMITISDNTASLWLQGVVGGATINEWLAAHGYDSTRVNSRVPGREEARRRFGWGQTTPREMARLLVGIRAGEVVSRAASEEMYRYLTRIHWNGEALSQLPPWVQAASKQGSVDRSKSEVVLVNAPGGDYVFCVITKNQADTAYVAANAGYTLLRQVSALLWKEFEPGHPWTPDPAAAALKAGDEGP
ncbi:MAG TPA: serine hydrolase [Gemmatirosa sp.]|nr:serine hydrolase [Gemmatirosa sp.]